MRKGHEGGVVNSAQDTLRKVSYCYSVCSMSHMSMQMVSVLLVAVRSAA